MPPKPTQVAARFDAMLRTPEVGSWFKDHASAASARTQLEQLELFCRRTMTSPVEILSLARRRPRQLQEIVQDYIRGQQAAGRSSRYALNAWWGIRSFLAHHGAAPAWVPKLRPVAEDDGRPLETVPTQEQMRAILHVLPTRGQAVALLLASSGIRVGVLATQFGPVDGLRLKHLPDLTLDPEPRFERTPFLIRVPAHLAKGSTVSKPRGYLTFGSSEAAEAIVAYLKVRSSRDEKLRPDSALVTADGRGRKSDRVTKDGTRFMARKALAFTIKTAMDRVKPAGVHWHTHTLRAWFSTQMESAESRGLISRSRREFFMGHSGRGVDFDYNLNRPKGDAKIEELRESYNRCEPLLLVSMQRPSDETQSKMAKVMLMGLGYSEEDLAQVDFEKLDVATFRDLVTKKVGRDSSADSARQRLVDSAELSRYLEDGWRVVTAVNGHQVVIDPPTR